MSDRMQEQLSIFNERIKRIEDPRNIYYIDPESGMNIPKRVSKAAVLGIGTHAKPGVMGLLLAVIIGLICLAGARYARFNLAGIVEDAGSEHIVMAMDFGIAAVIAFVIGGLINMKSMRHMMAQTAGIAVMAVAMHNLVWMYPAEFAQVYTQAYVDEVQNATQPNTIYVGGETFEIPTTDAIADAVPSEEEVASL